MNKVLVVDDNSASRDLVRAILKGAPYLIVEASHGQEALEKIRDEQPDLVLLDIDMPVLNGFAVVRHIREDSRLAGLPVLAVTAFAMEGDREKALAAGFTDYITKPVKARVLRKQVRELLGA
ncbi:MAG TPA: response regulator [Bryobacteraceae bacterium]|jgi:CheY-like chemotaxis protein|nr:response regulator [Bryobacteraceae bacterium]